LIDDELKMIALALIGVMSVATVYPILASHRPIEPFSEIGILGPNGKMEDYPKEVTVGQSFNLIIYISNHEGRAEYYRVLAKVGDKGSNVTNTTPLNTAPLASWDVVLMNEQNRTLPVTLSLSEVGVNTRLIFELHFFDVDLNSFAYHQRWTQLWLNVTAT
jgi:uncharacterized membrane protein